MKTNVKESLGRTDSLETIDKETLGHTGSLEGTTETTQSSRNGCIYYSLNAKLDTPASNIQQ